MCSKDKGKYKYKLECDYGCDGFDFDVKPKTRSDVSARMASVSSYSVRSAGVGDVFWLHAELYEMLKLIQLLR